VGDAARTGTDVEQFQSYKEAATQLLTDRFTAKCTPFQTSRWFNEVADQILANVKATDSASQNLSDKAAHEYCATVTDLKILAFLAKYHSWRMKAAVWYNVYLQSKDRIALERCIADEARAVENWRRIIHAAGDVYPKTLKFGVHRVGFSWHWTEELEKLVEGLKELRTLPCQASLDRPVRHRMLRRAAATPSDSLAIHVSRAPIAEPGRDLAISATVRSESELKSIQLRYRHLTQFEDYESAEMRLDPGTGKYVATIPGAFIIPDWDLIYFVEAITETGDGRMAPDTKQGMPYVIVPVKRK
jgi:hypothetical protein